MRRYGHLGVNCERDVTIEWKVNIKWRNKSIVPDFSSSSAVQVLPNILYARRIVLEMKSYLSRRKMYCTRTMKASTFSARSISYKPWKTEKMRSSQRRALFSIFSFSFYYRKWPPNLRRVTRSSSVIRKANSYNYFFRFIYDLAPIKTYPAMLKISFFLTPPA